MKYTKKVTTVEAIQFVNDNVDQINHFVGGLAISVPDSGIKTGGGFYHIPRLKIRTVAGELMTVNDKDYVVKDAHGKFHVYSEAAFEAEHSPAK